MTHRGPRARVVGAFVALLALAALVSLTPLTGPASAAGSDDSGSSLTRSGDGRFADLSVTVGKTESLGNEAVRVSWQWGGSQPGSHATTTDTQWNYNYLSVMQCWGDDADGPDRQQCQYGGQFSDRDAGTNRRLSPFNADPKKGWALSRVVSPVDVFGNLVQESKDPLEYSASDGRPADGNQPGIVPMHASPTPAHPDGQRLTSIDTGEFFDLYGTNEVPLARTNGDGSGQVYFEMQTIYESQFLGCGARLAGGGTPDVPGRSCWLVVVPRDSIDSNGEDVTTRASGSDRALFSSPLSLSNWKHRIVFPLGFEPVREPCALGGTERPVVGHESLSIAMSSWQTPLCAEGQGFFYATTTDDIARQTATSSLPKLSVVTDPLPDDALPSDEGSLVYAPLAASGVTVSAFIERYYASNVDPAYRVYNGTRVEELNLTPRLVAKLLTQSYRYSTVTIDGGPPHLAGAPLSLIDDPEFKAVNKFTDSSGNPILGKDLTHLSNQRDSLAKIFVSADSSDAIRLVWEWVLGDPEARAFLAGEADPYGMKVNPFFKGVSTYQDVDGPRADIPRLDDVCLDAAVGLSSGERRPVCPLDAAPYVAGFESGAALTARGQPTGSQSWVKDQQTGFVKPEKAVPQLVGQRALITITDSPSSQRRGLVAASLRNDGGNFVAPTSAAMSAALGQAVPTDVPGVSRVKSEDVAGDGYPLTRISYGVTNPAQLSPAARDDYADFTAFVGTDGQVAGQRPGQLPIGYVPLPRSMRAQTLAASQAIRTATAPTPVTRPTSGSSVGGTAKPATAPPGAAPAGTAGQDGDGDGASSAGGASGATSSGGIGALPAAVVPSVPAPSTAPADAAAPETIADVDRVAAITPIVPVSLLRWVLPVVAALGVGAAAASRLLARRATEPGA